MADRHRLVTRSDFDGIVCGALLKARDLVDEIKFVHPKDVQDGKVEITEHDITTNLPYSPRAHLVIDHHASETERLGGKTPANLVLHPEAPSAAHVVFKHFGGKTAFPGFPDDLLAAVDKVDSAKFTKDEILNPTGWVLLGFIMDSRTGFGRFKNFGVSNLSLMNALVDSVGRLRPEEILKLPDVVERVALYSEHREPFKDQLARCSKVHKNMVEVDLRNETTIYVGNRFAVYAVQPACNISMHVMAGRGNETVVFAIGKSILNRSSKTNVGALCLKHGGGGHEAAGTCQVDNAKAEATRKALIEQITRDG